jgi:hypothetical protein
MINTTHKSPMSWEHRWEELGDWVLREMASLNKASILPEEAKVLILDIHQNFLYAMKELEEK